MTVVRMLVRVGIWLVNRREPYIRVMCMRLASYDTDTILHPISYCPTSNGQKKHKSIKYQPPPKTLEAAPHHHLSHLTIFLYDLLAHKTITFIDVRRPGIYS